MHAVIMRLVYWLLGTIKLSHLHPCTTDSHWQHVFKIGTKLPQESLKRTAARNGQMVNDNKILISNCRSKLLLNAVAADGFKPTCQQQLPDSAQRHPQGPAGTKQINNNQSLKAHGPKPPMTLQDQQCPESTSSSAVPDAG